jgi:hypothetical protein
VRPDKLLYARVGSAVLLGTLVNPLAALIPLIETGPGKDADCGALLASVRPAAERAGQPVANTARERAPRKANTRAATPAPVASNDKTQAAH